MEGLLVKKKEEKKEVRWGSRKAEGCWRELNGVRKEGEKKEKLEDKARQTTDRQMCTCIKEYL